MFPVSQARPARSFEWRRIMPFAVLAAVALVAMFFLPATLLAQLPDTGTLRTTIQAKVRPLIMLVRIGLVVMCLIVGLFEGYKAAKGGQAGGWLKFVALLIVAGIAASPSTVLDLLGLTDVKSAVSGWGIVD